MSLKKRPYPLIIFGAGASTGALEDVEFRHTGILKWKPPLSNELFDRTRWDKYIQKWGLELDYLATDAFAGRSRHNDSIEEFLTALYQRALTGNKNRAKQFIALRFYLADLFTNISNNYHRSANNYSRLLHEIDDRTTGRACVVTYNYDTLFEKNINEFTSISHLDEFINSDLKLVKIHGSCNWVHKPISTFDPSNSEGACNFFMRSSNDYLDKNLELEERIYDGVWNFSNSTGKFQFQHYLPAISVPISNKKKEFFCPQSHIDALINALDEIDRILIIGWRAKDLYLVNLLKKHSFAKKIPIYIVANSEAGSKEIAKEFNTDSKFNVHACEANGFGQFLQHSREFNDFWDEA